MANSLIRVIAWMNKRRLLSGLIGLPDKWLIYFLICGVAFSAGIAAGTFESRPFCESGAAALYLGEYLRGLGSGGAEGTLRFFLNVSAESLAAFLMGFSVIGLIGIPALSLIRGFSAGFALSVFVRLYSGDGVAAGLLLVGLRTAVSLPVFLTVASRSLRASFELSRLALFSAPSGGGIYSRAYFLRFLAAIIILLLLSAGGSALMNWGISKLPVFA